MWFSRVVSTWKGQGLFAIPPKCVSFCYCFVVLRSEPSRSLISLIRVARGQGRLINMEGCGSSYYPCLFLFCFA